MHLAPCQEQASVLSGRKRHPRARDTCVSRASFRRRRVHRIRQIRPVGGPGKAVGKRAPLGQKRGRRGPGPSSPSSSGVAVEGDLPSHLPAAAVGALARLRGQLVLRTVVARFLWAVVDPSLLGSAFTATRPFLGLDPAGPTAPSRTLAGISFHFWCRETLQL